jgi:hypothetical protein
MASELSERTKAEMAAGAELVKREQRGEWIDRQRHKIDVRYNTNSRTVTVSYPPSGDDCILFIEPYGTFPSEKLYAQLLLLIG